MPNLELINVFNYDVLSETQRDISQKCKTEIRGIIRKTTYGAVEIGRLLLEVKSCLGYGHYRKWLELEFAWGKSTANKFENVARAFQDVHNLDNFDLCALYELSHSDSKSIRDKAIVMAQDGEYISHARAKALKSGTDTICLHQGKSITVQNGVHQGKQMTIKDSISDGLINMESEGSEITLLISELQPKSTDKILHSAKQYQSSQIELLSTELEIERTRVEFLEEILTRICTASRLGNLSDQLLSEAENFL